MENYDFDDFLSPLRHLDYEDIVATAKKRCQKLEKSGWKPNKKDALILTDKIKGLLEWMQTQKKPEQMQQADFLKLKSICENLVTKKELNPNALKAFEEAA